MHAAYVQRRRVSTLYKVQHLRNAFSSAVLAEFSRAIIDDRQRIARYRARNHRVVRARLSCAAVFLDFALVAKCFGGVATPQTPLWIRPCVDIILLRTGGDVDVWAVVLAAHA